MEKFQYGYFDARDRPPPIQAKHLHNDRIAATASQKLCLFRLFLIIFHDIVDQLPSIIVYKQLRGIVDLVLTAPFRKKWLPVLNDLCISFQTSMLDHFPTKMVPKVHFAAEYGQIIDDYGPAVKNWCLRYEACHAYFKKVALRSNNFKNPGKMLATRYQLKQSFTLSRSLQFSSPDEAIGIKKVQEPYFNNSMRQLLVNHFGDIDFSKDLSQCNIFWHENVEYDRSSVYIIGLTDVDERPVLIQIFRILRMGQKWWLLVDMLETISYHNSLCAWEIRSTDAFSLIDPYTLKYWHKAMDVYELNNSSYVSFSARLTSW
jgi:hypothetical protein